MTTEKATERPWRVGDTTKRKNVFLYGKCEGGMGSMCVAQAYGHTQEAAEANASLIVRAVNHHEELCDLLNQALGFIAGCQSEDATKLCDKITDAFSSIMEDAYSQDRGGA